MALTSSPRLIVVVLAALLGGTALVSGSSASAAGYTCDGRPATIVGTDRHDVLNGTEGDDVIVGLGGDDVIRGRGGNDTICGYADGKETGKVGRKDRLYGGSGNDRLVGTYEYWGLASGGPGNDSFVEIGVDHRDAPGPVTVDLEAGTGTGWGDDTYTGIIVVHGSAFADTIRGLDDPDEQACGCDYLYGHGGDDLLDGRDGRDELYGGDGADRLFGGSGKDTLFPGRGRDLVDGGDGGSFPADVVSYILDRRSVTVDLRSGTARGQGRDLLTRIEDVDGSPVADVIHGDSARNNLFGYRGDDVIRGHGGDDLLRGNAGDDRLYGGGGRDLAYGWRGDDRCRAEIKRSC